MAKILPVKRNSLTKILKKRNLQKIQQPKPQELKSEAVANLTPSAQDMAFDSYLKATARDMLKGMTKVELKINKQIPEGENFYRLSSENSIWAPWTKLFQSGK